jgi:predicted nucleic acid-binding protein
MRVVVADASSLILLAKCGLLRSYVGQVELLAAARVVQEAASSSLQQTYPDAALISELVSEGLVRVLTVRSRRQLPIALGAGEAATLRLFVQEEADRVLSDDGRALRACRLLGFPFTTTPRVAVDLVAARAVDGSEARRALEKLAVVGRYAPEVIGAALAALKEV